MDASNHWQCGKFLEQSLLIGLERNILCGVTFLVGEEEVRAHKFVLVCRSPIFYAQFLGPLSQSGPIKIEDIEPDIFKLFLQYLYSNYIVLTNENVTSIHYCSRKYCVNVLSDNCVAYMKSNISVENVCTILEEAHAYDLSDLKDLSMDFIQRRTNDVLLSEGFMDLSPENIVSILKCDSLTSNEEFIFEIVIDWSKKECSKKSIDPSDVNIRILLRNIIRHIRFPVMNETYFKSKIAGRDILSAKEVEDVFLQQFNKATVISCIQSTFPFKSRNYVRVKRFRRTIRDTIFCGETGTISFQSSKKICIHGIAVYTPKQDSFGQDVHIRLENEEHETILEITCTGIKASHDKMCDLLFPKSVQVIPNKSYTICTKYANFVKGYQGSRGKHIVRFKSSTISFEYTCHNYNSQNFGFNVTDVYSGQIPALLLSST